MMSADTRDEHIKEQKIMADMVEGVLEVLSDG